MNYRFVGPALGPEYDAMLLADQVEIDKLLSARSEDVLDQADTMSLSDLEAEIDGSGVDAHTCVDSFVELNGDTFFITKL